MSEPIKIDGSHGEGGGQIIRSSLTLSMITGRVVEIVNIRANRTRPGLLNQHLTAVNAAREVCNGSVMGAELGSRQLIFAPGEIQCRDFIFDIGSAGSTTLVAQTLIPALIHARGYSSLEILGGTHNGAAPPYEFLAQVYLPLLNLTGARCVSEILSWGFYPRGGGKIRIRIQADERPRGLDLQDWGGTCEGQVTALVSRLPVEIGERECELIRRKAGWPRRQTRVELIERSPGPGNAVMIRLSSPNLTELFTGFGKQGISADQVAQGVWREARDYLLRQAPVGEHLCDQLMLPLALSATQGETSSFVTGPLSAHSLTHIELISKFLDVMIKVQELTGDRQRVSIQRR
jgi:RNA 3'-terminal phosphate cyclase (ATP)